MIGRGTLGSACARADEPACRDEAATPAPIAGEAECLEQILEAFRDIADRDDIHQAGARLALVQDWIRRETRRAAADPLFHGLRLVS
jgi:hypothetical protein